MSDNTNTFYAYNDDGEGTDYAIVRDGDTITIPELGESFHAPLDEVHRADALATLKSVQEAASKEYCAASRFLDAVRAVQHDYEDEIRKADEAKGAAEEKVEEHRLVGEFIKALRAAVFVEYNAPFTGAKEEELAEKWDGVVEAAKLAILAPEEGHDQ